MPKYEKKLIYGILKGLSKLGNFFLKRNTETKTIMYKNAANWKDKQTKTQTNPFIVFIYKKNTIDKKLTTKACVNNKFVGTPTLFTFVINFGRNPSSAATKSPLAGPIIHVFTQANEPKNNNKAITGVKNGIPILSKKILNAIITPDAKQISDLGIIIEIDKDAIIYKTNIKKDEIIIDLDKLTSGLSTSFT